MTTTQELKIKKFVISMMWNLGGMAFAFILESVGKNLGLFNLSPEVTIFLGILTSRITKVVNAYFQEKIAENEL